MAWPSAEISVMGPEGAVNIIFRKQIEAAEDPDATRAQMIEGIRKTIDPYIAAGNAMVDDIIDPRETRPTVIKAFEMAATKRVERPWKTPRSDAGLTLRTLQTGAMQRHRPPLPAEQASGASSLPGLVFAPWTSYRGPRQGPPSSP